MLNFILHKFILGLLLCRAEMQTYDKIYNTVDNKKVNYEKNLNMQGSLYQKQFYVITGGPGTGKTTLLNSLQNLHYTCMPEVARRIIQEQMANNGDALPWKNKQQYSYLMLQGSIATYINAPIKKQQPVFFDRGIPDVACYQRLIEAPVYAELEEAITHYRYNKLVFILPFWKEIYHPDTERKQDLQEAEKTFYVMKQVYLYHGYKPIEVPKLSVKERSEFVKSMCE